MQARRSTWFLARPSAGRTLRSIAATALVLLVAGGSCARREAAKRPPTAPVPSASLAADATARTPASPADATAAPPTPPVRPPADGSGPAPIDRTAQCTQGPLEDATAELPADLLVESLYLDGAGDVQAGFRVYDDGRLEAKSIGGDWTGGRTIAAAKMEELRRAITDAQLGPAAGSHRLVQPGKTAGRSELRVRDGAEVVTVAADDPCFVPQSHQLLVVLAEVFD